MKALRTGPPCPTADAAQGSAPGGRPRIRAERSDPPPPGLRFACAAGLALVLALAGCASGPSGRDGPAKRIPPNLERVPDAVPRVERLRVGGPNKPYEIAGRSYRPETRDVPMRQRGLASWYGRRFHGQPTAMGEIYDMHAMTAAHATMPLPSYARVRNPANGREIIVRINDRGPFVRGRVIDLSYTAALKLDLLKGVAPVEVERLTHDEIRSGEWRRGASRATQAPVAAAPAPRPPPPAPTPVRVPEVPPEPDPVALTAPSPPPATPAPWEAAGIDPAAPGFWVQLGAFQARDGADSFREQVAAEVDWLGPSLSILADQRLHRLQAGPYDSRGQADDVAERVRQSLQLVPVVVERR